MILDDCDNMIWVYLPVWPSEELLKYIGSWFLARRTLKQTFYVILSNVDLVRIKEKDILKKTDVMYIINKH